MKKQTEEGLTVYESSLDGRLYCAFCGMPIENRFDREWKEIHQNFHKRSNEN